MDEMQAEREKIEAEKAENAKVLGELKALRAQLEGGQQLFAVAAATEEAVSDTARVQKQSKNPYLQRKKLIHKCYNLF